MDVLELITEAVNSVKKLGDAEACQAMLELEKGVRVMLSEKEQAEATCRKLEHRLVHTQQALAAGTCDLRKVGILYVDYEDKALKCFVREYGRTFRIFTASNTQDALATLGERKDEIGLVMAGQRMPGRSGRWLLDRVRQSYPRLLRILVSTFPTCADLCAACSAANAGAIYSYIVQPWDPVEIEHVLRRALEYFILRRELDQVARALPGAGETGWERAVG